MEDLRRGREGLGARLQDALQEQMGLVERVQQLEAERSSLSEKMTADIVARDAQISALQALAVSTNKLNGSPPAPLASGWSAAAERLDSLMELLSVAPEGDRVGRAARACERVKELRALSARAAERVRHLEALRAEQV